MVPPIMFILIFYDEAPDMFFTRMVPSGVLSMYSVLALLFLVEYCGVYTSQNLLLLFVSELSDHFVIGITLCFYFCDNCSRQLVSTS